MAGGRPRKPTEQLRREGGFRADRHGDRPGTPDGEPVAIEKLTGDALKLWKFVVPKLVAEKKVGAIHSVELTMLCLWWAEVQLWRRSKGEKYKRLIGMATAYKQFRTIAGKFGLSPAEWAALDKGGSGDDPASKFTEWFAARTNRVSSN